MTGAVRTWLSFGAVPDLTARGKRDGADYLAMARRGELRTYPGRTVPIAAFVADLKSDLAGVMTCARRSLIRTDPKGCAIRCRGR